MTGQEEDVPLTPVQLADLASRDAEDALKYLRQASEKDAPWTADVERCIQQMSEVHDGIKRIARKIKETGG